jgi:hypothetical protein
VAVLAPPVITQQPLDLIANIGTTAQFSIVLEGREPLTIQWFHGTEEPSATATNRTLTIASVKDSDAGVYVAAVFNDDGFTISSNAVLVVNHLPKPNSMTVERFRGQGTAVPIAGLLGSDVDGDTVILHAVDSLSALGGTVTNSNNEVIWYSPPGGPDLEDHFGFTVRDGRGGFASGTVTIALVPANVAPDAVSLQMQPNGSLRLQFGGLPGRAYTVEYSDSLTPPSWRRLGPAISAGGGQFTFDDTLPPNVTTRFYRAAYP